MRSILDWLDRKESSTTSTALSNASAYGVRGYVDTLSPLLLCISMDRSLRVRRFFFVFHATIPNTPHDRPARAPEQLPLHAIMPTTPEDLSGGLLPLLKLCELPLITEE